MLPNILLMSFKYIKNTRIKDPKSLLHKHYHLEQSSTKILSLIQIFDLEFTHKLTPEAQLKIVKLGRSPMILYIAGNT